MNCRTRLIVSSRPAATFHGRDIFAPAAAHLSLGVAPANFGESLDSFVELSASQNVRRERQIDGEIIYIDGYGNLFTNVSEHDLTGLPTLGWRSPMGSLRVIGVAPS